MSIISNILNSDLVQTGLCTIVEGAEVLAPATIAGNFLEASSENGMLHTVGKVLQSATTAFLAIWATWNVVDLFGDDFTWKYLEVVNYTAMGAAALVMSMPLLISLVKYLSSDNEYVESFQKAYSIALKAMNIVTAGIALGWFTYTAFFAYELALVAPIVLSAASIVSSSYSLYKNQVTA